MSGVPIFLTVRPMTESEISIEDENKYGLGIELLLFLVKHSRPDIANMTMKLS